MTRMSYEQYWNVVLGHTRDAEQVVEEFELTDPSDMGVDEWLSGAEVEAARACNIPPSTVDYWSSQGYHERASEEISDAICRRS